MRGSVAYFLKGERGQYCAPAVQLMDHDEELARQARKATRFLNSRIIRPVTPEPTSVAWYYKKPGPGRPKRCANFEEAFDLQMTALCGRIGPLFS